MDGVPWRQDLSQELDWLVPGVLVTLGLAAFSFYEMPRYGGILPALLLIPLWLLASAALAGLIAASSILRMMRSGVEYPIARCVRFMRQNAKLLAFIELSMVLTGLNMIAFMWVKPVLNYLVPFWADPYLAAAGISAMPSLHIATTGWMIIATRQFAPRWMLPMSAAGMLIFLLSVSLGWHYAVDGIFGLMGAYAIWRASLAILNARAVSIRTATQPA